MDSIETTLKWEDQFLEMDQINSSSTDDELRSFENHHLIQRVCFNQFKAFRKLSAYEMRCEETY